MKTVYGPIFTLKPYEHGISPTVLLGSLPVDVSSLPVNITSEEEPKST